MLHVIMSVVVGGGGDVDSVGGVAGVVGGAVMRL